MDADERADAEARVSHDPFPLGPRLIAGLVALGIGAAFVVIVVGWWKRGGVRRAVKGLAEEGAVALADAIVDEVFPAA